MDDVRERGLTLFTEIMGADRGAAMREVVAGEGFGTGMAQLATDFAFGSVWARDGLTRKQRSLVTLGILIALRQPSELKNHVRIAIANGLTAREIEEVVIQATPYTGFPATASAGSAVLEVLREAGLDSVERTAEERGML